MIIEDSDRVILLGGLTVPFLLSKGKKGRVRLSFSENGELHIQTGDGKLGNFEKQFLKEKERWIQKHFPSISRQADRKEKFLENIHHQIELFGKPVPLDYHIHPKTSFKIHQPLRFSIFAPEKHIRERKKLLLYYALRAYSEHYLKKKLDKWAAVCELEYNRCVVKDHKTKWGSCSSLRNINLNWHLIFLEDHLIDYVVIHELMHLHEMNHSQKFWNWVGKYHPRYQTARHQIKEKQWLIGILN
ncbi:MAG: M48 family metallopeptidase [Bacteroidia bacterium]|nr:M48 family metallopeptidase [Bacteroidia bacterium]